MNRLTQTQPRLSPKIRRYALIALTVMMVLVAPCVLAQNLPTDFALKSGNVTAPMTNNKVMTITQNSPDAIVEWNTFNIANAYKVVFEQPTVRSVILNRVVGNAESLIHGTLNANGRVFIVNPNGVYFGADAQVSVGGLIASTLAIDNDTFNAGVASGTFVFGNGTTPLSIMENDGTITVSNMGIAALLGGEVSNYGTITTPQGTITLVAGSQVTLDVGGDGLTDVTINAPAQNVDGVSARNISLSPTTGILKANGGQVLLKASGADISATPSTTPTPVSVQVVNNGLIQAQSLQSRNGKVVLSSNSPQNRDSVTLRGGTIDVSSTTAGVTGGKVDIDGYNVGMFPATAGSSGIVTPSSINVSGMAGGGGIDIEARNVAGIDTPSRLTADATSIGNGGTITINGAGGGARVYGNLSAHGGAQGGNGGSLETSGANLDVDGIRVDTSASNGNAGTWMLDPFDVTIVHGIATGSLPASDPFAPVTTSTVQDGDINNALNTGSNVIITTGNPTTGTDIGEIFIDGNAIDPVTTLPLGSVVIDRNNSTGNAPITFQLDASGGIKGNNFIIQSTSAGPLDVIFDTDANGITPSDASITLSSGTIRTNGGDISMFGQNDPVDGYAIGEGGISLSGITLDTRVGQNDANPGGNVLLRGRGGNDEGLSAVALLGSQIHSSTGDVTIVGDGSKNPVAGVGPGVLLDLGGCTLGLPTCVPARTSVTSTSGDILIVGLGVDATTVATSFGLSVEAADVHSTTGTIDLRGRRETLPNTPAVNGLMLSSDATVTSSGGPLWLTGFSTGDGGLSLAAGSQVDAGGGSVVLRAGNDDSADAIVLDGTVSGSVVDLRPSEVDVIGDIIERPTDAITIGIASGFSVSAGEIAKINATNALIFGSDIQSGAITVDNALTYDGSVTFEGGTIAIGAAVDVGANTLALIGGGAITQTAPITAGSLLALSSSASVQLADSSNLVASNTLAGYAGTGFTFINSNTVGIGDVSADGFAATSNTPTTRAASGITGGGDVLVRALTGNMILNGDVVGADVDLVSTGILDNAGGNTITATGAWRVWGNTWVDEVRGNLAGSGTRPNLYGCTFGTGCSSITVPTTGNHFIYTEQPILTIDLGSATREYGLPNSAMTYSASGLILDDQQANVLSGTPSTIATQSSNVGSYPITGKFFSPVGYVIDIHPGTLVISPATLTYTADTASRLYGAPNGTLTGSVTGFRLSDTLASATSGAPTFTTPATKTSNVGRYAIDGGGLTATNYVFVQNPANATALRILPTGQMFTSVLTRDTPTSYVYDRNFGPVAICPATDLLQAGRTQNGDNLAREWSRVRSRPNLANCVSLKPENACSSF